MILVTTGTHYLPFDRLLRLVDGALKNLRLREPVIVQNGSSNVGVAHATMIPYLPYSTLIKYITDARLVITSAGPATIFQILQHNRSLPIVVPRLKKYGEHVSDHQLYFARYLENGSKCLVPKSQTDLERYLLAKRIVMKKPLTSSLDILIDSLSNYLQKKD